MELHTKTTSSLQWSNGCWPFPKIKFSLSFETTSKLDLFKLGKNKCNATLICRPLDSSRDSFPNEHRIFGPHYQWRIFPSPPRVPSPPRCSNPYHECSTPLLCKSANAVLLTRPCAQRERMRLLLRLISQTAATMGQLLDAALSG